LPWMRLILDLIHDSNPLFTRPSLESLKSSDLAIVNLPAHSPDLKAYPERFIRGIKSECLDAIIPLVERHETIPWGGVHRAY
jgi:hypothetical protein